MNCPVGVPKSRPSATDTSAFPLDSHGASPSRSCGATESETVVSSVTVTTWCRCVRDQASIASRWRSMLVLASLS